MSRIRNEKVHEPTRITDHVSELPRKSAFQKLKDRLKKTPSRADPKLVERNAPPPPPVKEAVKLESQSAQSKQQRRQPLQPVNVGLQSRQAELESHVQPQIRTRSKSFNFITRHISKSKREPVVAMQPTAPIRPSSSPTHSTDDVKEHVATFLTTRTKSPPLPEHAQEQLSKYSREAPAKCEESVPEEDTKFRVINQYVPPQRSMPGIVPQAVVLSKPDHDAPAPQKPSPPVNFEPITSSNQLPVLASHPITKQKTGDTLSMIGRASPIALSHKSKFTEDGLTDPNLATIPDLMGFTKHDSATISTAETANTEPGLTHSREISDSSVHPSTVASISRNSREHTENEDYQRFLEDERNRLDKVTAYEGKIFANAVAEAAERATKKREMEAKQGKDLRRNKSVKEALKREISISQVSTISRTFSKSSRAIGNYIRPAPPPEGLARVGDHIIDSDGKTVVLTNDGPIIVARSNTRGSKVSRRLDPTLEQKRGHRSSGSKDIPISPALVEHET